MDNLELICFRIITAVGTARSLFIEAIQEAKNGDFIKAKELIEEGDKCFVEGHKAHAQLIQREASGDTINVSLLLLHAEDQLMSADGFKTIAEEMIELHKLISKIGGK
ncbi:PTS lactose/cellobiose transporter subunit IIA [[Eubacterium] hominis]|uniref:PTS lactose/cellobiose transporter subunit IIA n=1 Tax=[Eubacterium] hominis TaxID=2764325 RepID=UPI003A4DD9E0